MSLKKQLLLYFAATIAMGAALGIHESIFNNFLSDNFGLSAGERGGLEFPRELPGLLVVMMTGILCMLPVTQVGVIGAIVFALGIAGIAFFGGSFPPMVLMMMIASAGMHLLQPIGASIVLGLSGPENRGRRMGQAGAIGTLGVVLGAGGIWLLFDKDTPAYAMAFLVAGGVGLVAAFFFGLMHIPHLHQPRARLVYRKQFGLYYLLEFLFGTRKQIFLTFGPWVLIRVYGMEAKSIAGLLMTASLIGIVFKPLAGMAIDRFGERTIMVVDGIVLSAVCLGYGYAYRLAPTPAIALNIACTCFILDNLLFALGHSRSVYLSRMTESPQELTSSLAMGISINHIASMTIPMVAGATWAVFGHESVFLAAAIFALGISAVSMCVPRKAAYALAPETAA